MKRSGNLLVALCAATLVASCNSGTNAGAGHRGGAAGTISFAGQEPFLPGFAFDSGLLPPSSPAQVRVVAHAGGAVMVTAKSKWDGSMLTPVPGSGTLSTSGEIVLEVYGKLDVSGITYDGLIQSLHYAVAPANTTFDPFLQDSEASVMTMLPPAELGTFPVPSVPGATVTVSVAGGELATSFRGTCARAMGDRAQYRGAVSTHGTVSLAATFMVSVPIIGSKSFGPFPVDVAVPMLTSDLDLGTFSRDGMPATGGQPVCSDTGDAGEGGVADASSGGSDAGVERTDAGNLYTSCVFTPGAPLAAPCLPRCSAATRTTYDACGGDTDCSNRALAADTTPALELATGQTLDCTMCVMSQAASCAREECPASFEMWLRCDGPCDAEYAALLACIEGLPAAELDAYTACSNDRYAACFGP